MITNFAVTHIYSGVEGTLKDEIVLPERKNQGER